MARDLAAGTRPAGLPVWAFVTLMTALTAISALSNNLFLPSMPAMTEGLKTDAAAAQVTLSAFTIAFAVAQLVWGPVSDRYGRRGVLIAGMALYFVASLACWQAGTIEEMIAYRVLQAVGVCCAPVLSRAIVRDVYELRDAARILSYVSAALALTPVLAPALGALIDEAFGWRANFLFMVGTGAAMLLAAVFLLPETGRGGGARLHPAVVARGYASVLSSRLFLGHALTVTAAFATIFIFNSVTPFFFIGTAHLTPTEFAIPYAVIALTYGVTAYANARFAPRFGFERTVMLGAVISLAGGVVLWALIAGGSADAWWICGAMGIVTLGLGFVFPNCQAGAVAPFPERAGAASAMSGFLQMTMAALAGMAVMLVYDGTAHLMAVSILAFLAASVAAHWLLIARHRPRA
jgi:DHA1 family bicyclomycin/chloramphenicol resistance-like MFS transporter